MSVTSQDIVTLEEQLADLKKGLEADYAAFGGSCALAEGQQSLGTCRDEWLVYEQCLEEVTRREKVCDKQQHRLNLITDKKGLIRQSERDLELVARQKGELCGKLGAAAYEAFQNGRLETSLQATCKLAFQKHVDEIQSCQEAMGKGRLSHLLGALRLSLGKRKTYTLFLRCGEELLSSGSYHSLPDEALRVEADNLLAREEELQSDLVAAKSNVSSLEAEVDQGRKDLENARAELSGMKTKLASLACTYGKAVYDQIPPDVISRRVGQKAYDEGLAIVRRQNDMATVQEQIRRMQNQMQIDELNVQLDLDNQKIAHLKEQEQAIEKQISEVQLSIVERKRKIQNLSGADHV